MRERRGTVVETRRASRSHAWGYTAKTGHWSIYWRDRHMKSHEYKRRRPTKNVQSLLDYIDSHEDPIFWGLRAVSPFTEVAFYVRVDGTSRLFAGWGHLASTLTRLSPQSIQPNSRCCCDHT